MSERLLKEIKELDHLLKVSLSEDVSSFVLCVSIERCLDASVCLKNAREDILFGTYDINGQNGCYTLEFPVPEHRADPGESGTLILSFPAVRPREEALAIGGIAADILSLCFCMQEVDGGNGKERDPRVNAAAEHAISALSYSEMIALRAVLSTFPGDQGVLVASRMADRCGITRSVIVSALRKMEGAGMITEESHGMRGTGVRILNPALRHLVDDLGL